MPFNITCNANKTKCKVTRPKRDGETEDKVFGEHDSYAKARQQQKALYANIKEGWLNLIQC